MNIGKPNLTMPQGTNVSQNQQEATNSPKKYLPSGTESASNKAAEKTFSERKIESPPSAQTDSITKLVMDKYELSPDTRVFRMCDKKFLDLNNMRAHGNPTPESTQVRDFYNMVEDPVTKGYIEHCKRNNISAPEPRLISGKTFADKLAPCLNVSVEPAVDYYVEGMVLFSFRLGDALDIGARIYPDETSVAQLTTPLIITIPTDKTVPIQLEDIDISPEDP
ncbi:AvrPphF family type III effector [Endozoicomonas numazuensis]|uniref:Uncharacterized protein n=1 Tax=Endozoicomonas numazuensis TaxID=1137799 RepID=A0A081NHE9_9GAMM|nr:AvrPphF family type III effector [Endozoicomonas numazuensis]KEQ17872.1 hypothetical protein GZ78_09500 [Endozoicomonas numazuensis]